MGNSLTPHGGTSGREVRTLRRVVPIARTEVHDGLACTLIALEDYADGFDVTCRLIPMDGYPVLDLIAAAVTSDHGGPLATRDAKPAETAMNVTPMVISVGPLPDFPDHVWPRPILAARDDRGNDYAARNTGGGETEHAEFDMHFSFRPALDRNAVQLSIQVAEIVWASQPVLKPNRPPKRVDSGPWIFPVDLTAGLDVVQSGRSA